MSYGEENSFYQKQKTSQHSTDRDTAKFSFREKNGTSGHSIGEITTKHDLILWQEKEDSSAAYLKCSKRIKCHYYMHKLKWMLDEDPKVSDSIGKQLKKHVISNFEQISTAESKLLCPNSMPNPNKKIIIPNPNGKKKLLLLDLDETLVHCNKGREFGYSHAFVESTLPNGDKLNVIFFLAKKKLGINIRPYTQEFLETIKKLYCVVVFTSAHESYAKAVVDYLDPGRNIFSAHYSRKLCDNYKGGV
jgi:TFIIF-interacting CTD phosphatase-like protein